jgi:hypothetical protein
VTTATTKPPVTTGARGSPAIGVGPPAAASPVGGAIGLLPPASADAPQLAGSPPASEDIVRPATPGVSSAVSATGPASAGLPDHHAQLRIMLSLVTIAIAVIATAQLPASRRLLRHEPEPEHQPES